MSFTVLSVIGVSFIFINIFVLLLKSQKSNSDILKNSSTYLPSIYGTLLTISRAATKLVMVVLLDNFINLENEHLLRFTLRCGSSTGARF